MLIVLRIADMANAHLSCYTMHTYSKVHSTNTFVHQKHHYYPNDASDSDGFNENIHTHAPIRMQQKATTLVVCFLGVSASLFVQYRMVILRSCLECSSRLSHCTQKNDSSARIDLATPKTKLFIKKNR